MQEMHTEMQDVRNDCSNTRFLYLASRISWICDTAVKKNVDRAIKKNKKLKGMTAKKPTNDANVRR
jgi:hypothetical protein